MNTIQNAFRRMRPLHAHHMQSFLLMASGKRCREAIAHHFAFARAAVRVHATSTSLGLEAHDLA